MGAEKRYNVKRETADIWFKECNKIPLQLLQDTIILWHNKNKSNIMDFRNDVAFFLKNIEALNCRGSSLTKLPLRPTKDMLYLVGIIMGDGCLPERHNGDGGKQYEVYIEKANKNFIYFTVKPLIIRLFGIEPKISRDYRRQKVRYRCYFKSRIVYAFLRSLMDIPSGKKSNSVRFPNVMANLSLGFKIALLAGFIDTDWGRQRWIHFGTHMGSRKLAEDYKKLMKILGIEFDVKRYVQKGKFISYQCYVKKGYEKRLLNILNKCYPIRNQKRIRFLEKAGVAESGKCARLVHYT